MKKRIFIIAVSALSLIALLIMGGCKAASSSHLKVVTSTSLIAQIVERVGGDKVDVVNIIPPAQCPGHFDVKPGDIQKLADADLFLMHNWQGEQFSQDLIASANNPNLSTVIIDITDNWMTPSVQETAIDKITSVLSQADAENSSAYQKSAAELKNIIETKGAEIKARLAKANLSGINVMCADQQVGFIKWAGFNVVDIFGRPETLTTQIVKDLVDKGRAAKVTLIIDNLQSGEEAGAGIAEELDSKRVILSNFPGGFDNTETWEKAIDRNIEILLGAIAN